MTTTTDAPRQDVLKRALLQLKELQTKLAEAERWRTEAIAVIGLGCRFPGGAHNPDQFWQLLHEGRDAITDVPPDRWDVAAYFDPDPAAAGKMYTRRGGFLACPIEQFDADFFAIKPREAATLDPQQRLLLEVSWEALEHAGQPPDRLKGSATGVFVGISTNDYAQRTLFAEPGEIDVYSATGNALNAAAGRLAYFFGLQGPAVAVDTACSSSLVAVHYACVSLRQRECRLALAGGVNLILTPHGTIATCRARMMAPDGRCKTFDAAADGYVRGEGCGLVVLKRLADALADRDRIWAVLRGSAVNQDGASSALTVPNGVAQQELLSRALAQAGVAPSEISYLEAHGTGTSLGDPIEVESIQAVLGLGRPSDRPCAIGSVKTNIGHLEAAAGVAGLIKLVLGLHHQEIPPHLHLKSVNPHITLAGTPFEIPTAARAWPAGPSPRRAGVSSFGFTGTNAHVVVEEAPAPTPAVPAVERPLHVLSLSGRNDPALRELAARYVSHLSSEVALADVAFTANAGRAHFSHRLAVVAETPQQAREALAAFVHGTAAAGLVQGQAPAGSSPRVAYFFPGQGLQPASRGRQLYDTQPTFRRALEQCDESVSTYLPQSPLAELHRESGVPLPLTEPALFALEYALARLWQSWGVEPLAVAGQGVGEYVAACVAGVLSLVDALHLLVQGVDRADAVRYSQPRVRFLGMRTGQWVEQRAVATAAYWRAAAGSVVSSSRPPVPALEGPGYDLVLEMAAGPRIDPGGTGERVQLPSLPTQGDDWRQVLETVARLYVRGVKVDWANFDKDYPRRVVPLPTYPFQPARHWIEADRRGTQGNVALLRQTRHPYLGQRVLSPLAPVQFLTQFSLRRLPQVKDHVLRGMPWVNLVIYLEMALAAAVEVFGPGERSLAEVNVPHGLVLGQEEQRDVQLVLTPHEDGNAAFQIFSLKSRPGNAPGDAAAAWTLHAAGRILVARDLAPASSRVPARPEHVRARCPVEMSGPVFYDTMRRHGAQLGPSYLWIDRVWQGDGEALGRARPPGTPDDASTGYHLCIGPVDACFQLLFAVLPTDQFGYLLSSLKSFRFFGRPVGRELWCQARRVSPASEIDPVVADAWLFDESGAMVAEATGAGLQSVSSEALRLQAQLTDRPVKRSGRPAALQELQATPADRRAELLTTYLLESLAEALETPVAGLDPHMPLAGQLDSLMAIELKSRVEADLPVNIPMAVFFDGGSLASLGSVILEQLRAQGLATATSDTAVPDSLARLLEEVELMSEDEAQARLGVDQPGGRGGRVDE